MIKTISLLLPLITKNISAFTQTDSQNPDYTCYGPAKTLQFTEHKQSFGATNDHERYVCEFCDDKLLEIVERVCCGNGGRKRREVRELDFWFGVSHQESKLVTPSHNNKVTILNPNELILKHRQEECVDELSGKNRMKRQTDESNQLGGDLPYYQSLQNGGKGRTVVNEILTKMSCSKNSANNFLSSRSIMADLKGAKYDRKNWKHTSVDQECCVGLACTVDEVNESYLFEECCQEGCVLEEVEESCQSWRIKQCSRDKQNRPHPFPPPLYANELNFPIQHVETVPGKWVSIMTVQGSNQNEKSIILNSHIDVVPVYPEHWTHPPFSAHKDENGDIWARGSQDMKLVGVQYMEAIRRLRQKNPEWVPKRTLLIVWVPDEEIGGGDGMKKLLCEHKGFFDSLNVGFELDEGLGGLGW